MDMVQVDWSQGIFSVKWRLLAGEGEKQTLQLMTSEGLGYDYYSNVVTIDYEVPVINRVVTSQYVAPDILVCTPVCATACVARPIFLPFSRVVYPGAR